MAGRPLRFLALTAAGWTAIRVVALWPSIDGPAALIRAVVPPALAKADQPRSPNATVIAATQRLVAQPQRSTQAHVVRPHAVPVERAKLLTIALEAPSPVTGSSTENRTKGIAPPLAPTPPSPASRLSGSAWVIARGGSNRALLGGQLGASQAGVRLLYALDEARRVSLTARVATPLHGRGREAAVGIEWHPAGLPARFIAEQRIALDGGRGGPSALAIGGIGPTPVAAGFDVEAYGQAGAIVRDRLEGFADGAGRVTRPVLRLGGARLDLGLGAWGGAQRGAGRFDVGPTVGVMVPVARRSIRLTLDWRERVAGHARPGSGPALSLGSDF